jgi:hypothetical protein
MTTYTNPFTGQTISPSQVGYLALTLTANTTLQWPINGNTGTVAANIINVTNTVLNLQLALPSAYQVSTGQALIIKNVSGPNFTVTDSGGNSIISITSGLSYYIYLTDNTTSTGTWSYVLFGGSTSSSSAAQLAGYGLTAVNTTLNQTYYVQPYYGSTSITASAQAQMNVWLGGAGTLTLPSASTVGANWFTIFKNDGTGILTLSPTGSDTIDGNANQQLQLTESLVLVSAASSGWYTFAYGRSNSFAYTQYAATVTGGTLVLTSAQASNTIQVYSGVLTSNQIIQVPSTVQLYTVTNNTSGAYTFTVKTSSGSGATVQVTQNTSLVLVCDGTNVYNATSGTSSSITSLTLGNGSAAAPSLKFSGDTTTGLYLPTSGDLGFTVSGTAAAQLTSTGLYVVNGISGGGF